ncbi:MAG: nucleoside triphosphate pyrophosphohydrolase [Spirochaetes bacterium]|jgi:tetrapyrrole methylase family protein/MazG family protein|nr:nucleoside triphosphate pyrophosphohydrolase [Spirochaetota bacterium]
MIDASFSEFFDVIRTLRGPAGCPWDRKQTPESMRPYLLEETYEVLDAVDMHDDAELREELGDVFLIATMMAYIKEQEGAFTVGDVFDHIRDKLIRRHPHVFGTAEAETPEAVAAQWDRIKTDVEGKAHPSALDGVPDGVPPLSRALELQKRAQKRGFDWDTPRPAADKVTEELDEVLGLDPADHVAVESEIGDLLFSVVNLSRKMGVDPSIALHRANGKFKRRFKAVEREMERRGIDMSSKELKTMDAIWSQTKQTENP